MNQLLRVVTLRLVFHTLNYYCSYYPNSPFLDRFFVSVNTKAGHSVLGSNVKYISLYTPPVKCGWPQRDAGISCLVGCLP